MLCSVEWRAQHTAWRGVVSGRTSPQSSGRKLLPEIRVKKGQNRKGPFRTKNATVLNSVEFYYCRSFFSGKEKAHKHKQIFPVTARAGGGLPTGWGGGVSRPVARGQKFMCCVRNPRNINIFVRVPGREDSGSQPGGSVTGVTEKLFMCQMFMCLFWPLFLLSVAICCLLSL